MVRMPPPRPLDIPAVAPGGLARRYLADPAFARDLYGRHWRDPGAAGAVADEVASRTYPRAELAAILRRQNATWGMTAATARAIDTLEAGAFAVFTGQQAGLLCGPLYTIYKSLAAVRQAERLAAEIGAPVVPVFWIAGDDHDIAEIDHVVLPDGNGHPRSCQYGKSTNPGARVARRRFGDDLLPCLESMLPLLGDGPGRDEVFSAIRDAYRPGATWVNACARLLARWVGPYGIIFVSPDDVALKRLMAPVFRAEIVEPERSLALVAAREEAVRAAGHAPQVGRTTGATLLFIDDAIGARQRVDRVDGLFSWGGDGGLPERATTDELLRILAETPDRLSANSLLRPVSADAIFPTLLHVMGPGEIGYMAQARAIYERHGVPMPIVAPRAAFTVVPAEIDALLAAEDLPLEDAFQPADRWFGALAGATYRVRWAGDVDTLRRALDAAYDRLDDRTRASLPGVWTAVAAARLKTQALANRLAGKLAQEVRRAEADRRARITRIVDALYPLGHPQERVYPIAPYLVRHGLGWLDVIRDAIDPESAAHLVLRPED